MFEQLWSFSDEAFNRDLTILWENSKLSQAKRIREDITSPSLLSTIQALPKPTPSEKFPCYALQGETSIGDFLATRTLCAWSVEHRTDAGPRVLVPELALVERAVRAVAEKLLFAT